MFGQQNNENKKHQQKLHGHFFYPLPVKLHVARLCLLSENQIKVQVLAKECSSYEGDSISPRKSAAKLLVFKGNSRSPCMLYINILLAYAHNLNKIG